MKDITFKKSALIGNNKGDLVAHGFLGRVGGVSKPPYDSLNLSFTVGDDDDDVTKNIELAASELGFRSENLVTIKQVHGSETLLVDKDYMAEKSNMKPMEADAIITKLKWVAIGVLTADCVPLVLYDPVKGAVGVVHAGWRGTLKGIAGDTVTCMSSNFGSKPSDIRAAIGPCIGPCCFRVDAEVIEDFKELHPSEDEYVVDDERIDLQIVNRLTLTEAGLSNVNIEVLSECTVCKDDSYFSHRRDSSEDGSGTGRQLTFAMTKTLKE